MVFVEGVAGMGKTSLLRSFSADLGTSTLLRASGYEDEVLYAYGVLEQLLAGIPAADGLLARLRSRRGQDPLEVGAGLLHVVNELDGEGPVIALIDDVHWADAPSAGALAFALRRLHFDHVLAILALRPDEPATPAVLQRLASTERSTRLCLGGLSVPDLGELSSHLSRAPLPRSAAEHLEALTDSNPLYALAMLEEVDPALLARIDEPLPAPRSFAAGVIARLGSCPADARRLVEAASVLGQRCPLGLAAGLAQIDDVGQALGRAVSARLIEAGPPSRTRDIRFLHPLTRSAVYHALLPTRRAELHEGAAALVEDPASLEHRIAAALVEDAELSATVATYARGEAAAGSSLSAAAHLASAARLCSERSLREGLTLEAVEQLLLAGEIGRSVILADGVADFAPSAMRDYVLGYLSFMTGRSAEAEAPHRRLARKSSGGRRANGGVGGLAVQHCLHHAGTKRRGGRVDCAGARREP